MGLVQTEESIHLLKFPFNIKTIVSGLVVTISVFLVLVASQLLYENAQVNTDENLFTGVPSRALAAIDIPAERLVLQESSSSIDEYAADTIYAGDLVCRVGDELVQDTTDLWSAVAGLARTQPVFLEVLTPHSGKLRVLRVQRETLTRGSFVTIPPAAHVVEVLPGGVSDRAGMKVGDLIVSINNQEFEDIFQADRIMRESRYDTHVDYVVIRGAQSLLLEIQLANFGFQVHVLASFLVGLLTLLLGMLLAFLRPNYAAALIVGFAMIFMGFVIMTMQISSPSLPRSEVAGALRLISFPLFVGLWSLSTMYFPRIRRHVPWRRTRFVLVVLLFLAATSGLIVREVLFYLDDLFLWYIAFHALFLIVDLRIDNSLETKANYRFHSVFIAVAAFAIVVSLAMPAKADLQIQSLVFVSLIAIPVSVLVSIGRHRLFDLELRVRRNIQYVALSTLWTLFILGLLVYVVIVLPSLEIPIPAVRITGISIELVENLTEEDAMIARAIANMTIVLITGALLMKVRVVGHKVISRFFYQSDRDYRSVGSSLSELLSSSHNPRELATGYAWWLARNMDIERVGIAVLHADKISSVGSHKMETSSFVQICQKWERVLIELFAQKYSDVAIDQLPDPIRQDMAEFCVTHLIPMRSDRAVVGIVFLGEKLSETEFTWDELEFIGSTAKQVGVAIENVFLTAELHEQERLKTELAIARRIQLESLPQTTPNIPGLDIAGISSPAMEVGGDFYDYNMNEQQVFTVIVGDVSGKGTSAAFYMSKIQGVLRTLHGFFLSPRQLLLKTNEILKPDMSANSFITSVCAQFSSSAHSLVFARAGHVPVVHYRAATKQVLLHKPVGIGIGIVNSDSMESKLDEMELYYEKGDVFVFLSDGVTEARNPAESEFGIERVQGMLKEIAGNNARFIRDRILTAAQKFAGEEGIQHDDLTIVVVKATA